MTDQPTLFEFPCDFPLKVMGKNTPEFRALVLEIVKKHVGELEVDRVQERPSKDGTYLSVTLTVHAQSKEQLDNLYRELTSNEQIRYVL